MTIGSGHLEAVDSDKATVAHGNHSVDFGTTFNLGLSSRQKRSRDDVVLPYFAAQDIHADKVGEIEYILDAEDDFDDEEDVDEDLLIWIIWLACIYLRYTRRNFGSVDDSYPDTQKWSICEAVTIITAAAKIGEKVCPTRKRWETIWQCLF